ncbi:MAG: hypothetical protein OXT65_12925 [Alphaproteobacteria bacterium]|nr:hypothetical protein [Alphaproteobacteria bacterium]
MQISSAKFSSEIQALGQSVGVDVEAEFKRAKELYSSRDDLQFGNILQTAQESLQLQHTRLKLDGSQPKNTALALTDTVWTIAAIEEAHKRLEAKDTPTTSMKNPIAFKTADMIPGNGTAPPRIATALLDVMTDMGISNPLKADYAMPGHDLNDPSVKAAFDSTGLSDQAQKAFSKAIHDEGMSMAIATPRLQGYSGGMSQADLDAAKETNMKMDVK